MSELTKVELLANRQWEGVVAKVEAERDRLTADLAAAKRELEARKSARDELFAATKTGVPADWLTRDVLEWLDERVAELLAQEGGK